MRLGDRVEDFIVAATGAGWRLRRRDPARPLDLPEEVAARYGTLPPDYSVFLHAVAEAASADQAVWLLCEDDFRRQDPAGFAWNEIEKMALGGTEDDAEKRTIAAFWDRHLPIAMAPDGDYDYLAISMRDGAVVHGYAPEWEEVTHVAPSFDHWLGLLSDALLDPSLETALAVRLMARRST